MKYLHYISFWLATFAAAGLAGCAPADKLLSANQTSLEISAEDTSHSFIEVTSSASWMVDIAGKADWLSYEYDDNNPAGFWVWASVNESLEERAAEITVVSGDGLILAIPVVQSKMDVRLDVTPHTLPPFGPRDTSERPLTVDTNLASGWEFSALHSSPWLNIIRGTEAEGTENILTVGVSPSRLFLVERRDTIVLRPLNDAFLSLADSIAVVQTGLNLVVESDAMNEETYEIEIPSTGGEVPLRVYSAEPWRLSVEAPAGTVTVDLSEGPADIENGTPIVLTVMAGAAEEESTFTLVFDSDGETYEYICRQQGNPAEPEQPEETEGI